MAENRATINHFLKRTAKELEYLKSEAVRLGGGELAMLVHLIERALVEAQEQQTNAG